MDIYLYGCGGHAKVILDILYKQGRNVKALIDDNPPLGITHIHGVPVKKTSPQTMAEVECDSSQWIVAIGSNHVRRRIVEKLESFGYLFTNAIHPSAEIGYGVKIGCGTVVMANAVINVDTEIGDHVIINTAATIDHDCKIGDFSHISPGCHLCGQVSLNESVFLGVGSKVIPGVSVGEHTLCGAGSVIVKPLPSSSLAYGCPAKVIRTNYTQK
jgi:sugar O-acyltransferase (sialic acid O-acetyltransferase NeuD family)